MIRYFKRHALSVISALLLGILTQLLTPVSAVLEQRMVDLIVSGDMQAFLNLLWAAGAMVTGIAFCYFLSSTVEKQFAARFEESLRNDLFEGVMRRSASRFAEEDTAVYMSYITSSAGTLVQNLTQPVFYLISYGVSALVVLGIMLRYSPLLAILSLACGGISMVLPLRFHKRLGGLLADKVEKTAAMGVQLKEALSGHEVIFSYGVFANLRRRFVMANTDVARTDQKLGITISELENIGHFMDRMAWILTFWVAGTLAVRGDITVGTLVMFVSLFAYFSGSVTVYAQCLPLLLSNRENIQLLLGIIDEDSKDFTGGEDVGLTDRIEIRGLSFGYQKEVPVLEKLDLTIHKNEKVALTGPSGCGKSTLIKLLTGSRADYTGSICYDGRELHDIAPEKLRELVTVIHQNTFIFNDTLRFNICLGEEFPAEELRRAVELSGVARFLSNIPGGLEGDCGESGSRLSGGERQRIALARALIRGVKVLILDEGVSAIDVATANEIEQELLDRKDLTLLTVTHRIRDGLTQQYDRILVMRDGRVEGKVIE